MRSAEVVVACHRRAYGYLTPGTSSPYRLAMDYGLSLLRSRQTWSSRPGHGLACSTANTLISRAFFIRRPCAWNHVQILATLASRLCCSLTLQPTNVHRTVWLPTSPDRAGSKLAVLRAIYSSQATAMLLVQLEDVVSQGL